jgi:AcrR family transcriptional regulator
MAERGSYAKGVAKRDEILRAALDVFAREGYRGTSLREVAKAAGLSLPGLMHYFDSKEDLLTAVLAKRDAVDSEAMAGHEQDDAIDMFLAVMRHNSDVPGLVQLYSTLAAAASDPAHPAHDYFLERFQTFRLIFADYVATEIAAGNLPARLDPMKTASTLLAIADGLQLQWMVDPSIDMAEHIDYAWRMLTTP